MGNGAISDILHKNGYSVTAYDKGMDFLKEKKRYKYIITNPPFSLANEIIEKCYDIARERFFLLLPLNYLQGQKRYDQCLFGGLKRVWVFTRMPMLSSEVRKDGKYKTGMQAYAWFEFDPLCSVFNPVIKWIDNSMWVLRKSET